MKYGVTVLAVALLALQATTAAAHVGTGPGGGRGIGGAGGGGGDANWYLQAQDGSYQGPYGLSQLGEWTNAGYVSPGKLGNVPLGIPFVLQQVQYSINSSSQYQSRSFDYPIFQILLDHDSEYVAQVWAVGKIYLV